MALDIHTQDGTTYKHCDVTKVEPDGIVISYSDGVARIPFENLPETIRSQYHFDPAKVADYRRRIAEAKAAAIRKATEEVTQSKEVKSPTQKEHEAKPQQQAIPTPTPDPGFLLSQWAALSQQTRIITLLAAAAITLVILSSIVSRIKRHLEWKHIRADAHEYLELAQKAGRFPTVETDVILKPDEKAYYSAPSSLYETRAVRHYQSGFAGFRVAKGIWVGGSSGRSVSNQEWTKLDSGMLTITNQRVIFDGASTDRTISIKKLVSVHPMRDSVELSVENRQKSMIFQAANPLILATVIGISGNVSDDLS